MEQLEYLEERNKKIIDAVIKKAESLCPGSLALIGIYGSFLTGDIHPKSDLDLLILINDDRGYKLSSTFIQEDEQVGHDIYCTTWESLRGEAQYGHPNISKLMDSKIVYCTDDKYLKELEQLRTQVKEKLAAEFSEEDFDKAFESMEEAEKCMKMVLKENVISKVGEKTGGVLYFLGNAITLLNKQYIRMGVKLAYEELNGMEKRPENLCELIEAVISSHTTEEIKERLMVLMQKTMKVFAVEGARFGKTVSFQLEQDETEDRCDNSRKQPTAEALKGTYEEMYSNWRNKMYVAAQNNNRYLAFMSLISFYSMLSEIAGEWEIGNYDSLAIYNPDNLYATAQAFDAILNAYLSEYRKVGLSARYYKNIDAFICDYLLPETVAEA